MPYKLVLHKDTNVVGVKEWKQSGIPDEVLDEVDRVMQELGLDEQVDVVDNTPCLGAAKWIHVQELQGLAKELIVIGHKGEKRLVVEKRKACWAHMIPGAVEVEEVKETEQPLKEGYAWLKGTLTTIAKLLRFEVKSKGHDGRRLYLGFEYNGKPGYIALIRKSNQASAGHIFEGIPNVKMQPLAGSEMNMLLYLAGDEEDEEAGEQQNEDEQTETKVDQETIDANQSTNWYRRKAEEIKQKRGEALAQFIKVCTQTQQSQDRAAKQISAHQARKQRVVVETMLRLPVPGEFSVADAVIGSHDDIHPPANITPNWSETNDIVRKRLTERVNLRRTFQLSQVRKNRLEQTLNIGRKWHAHYESAIAFGVGHDWGTKRLKLEPVFSGLMEESLEKTSVAAIQNMPYIFSGTRVADFTPQARYAIRDLVNRPFNAIRYLYRLTVLFVVSRMMEQSGMDLVIDGINNPPDLRYIGAPGDMSLLITEAATSQMQVVYVELAKVFGDQTIMDVFMLAGSGSWLCKQRLPSVSKLWPVMENVVVAAYQRVNYSMNIGRVSSASVWTALELYTQMYGLQDELESVMSNVATFILRPEGDGVFNGHQAIQMAIPESRMEGAAIGPMASQVRNWMKQARLIQQPRYEELVWSGTQRYLAWTLAYKQVLVECGVYSAAMTIIDEEEIALWERLVYMPMAAPSAQVMAEGIMGQIGWENGLGTDLRSVIGMTKTQGAGGCGYMCLTPLRSKQAPQWEEALPYLSKMPDSAAISALLYPAIPREDGAVNRWLAPEILMQECSTSYALYSVGHLRRVQFGYAEVDLQSQLYKIKPYRAQVNYRGALADAQMSDFITQGERYWRPVFRFGSQQDYLQTWLEAKRMRDVEWYIEAHRDESFDGILAGIQSLRPQPTGGRGAMYSASRTSGAEAAGMGAARELNLAEEAGAETMDPPGQDKLDSGVPKVIQGITAPEKVPITRAWRARRDAIVAMLGGAWEPTWLKEITEMRDIILDKPADHQRLVEQKYQIAKRALIEEDFRNYIPALLSEDTAKFMKTTSAAILDLAAFAPSGGGALDVMTMAVVAADLASTAEATGGALELIRYKEITGKEVPTFIDDEVFTRAMNVGLRAEQFVTKSTLEEVEQEIERKKHAIEDFAQRRLAAIEDMYVDFAEYTQKADRGEYDRTGTESDTTSAGKGKAKQTGIIAQQTTPSVLETGESSTAQEPEIREVTALQTAEMTIPLEQIPEQETSPNFGPTPSQPGIVVGEQAQPEGSPTAGAAERQPIGTLSSVSFQATVPRDQPSSPGGTSGQ